MNRQKVSAKRFYGRLLITIFCAFIISCVSYVFLFWYTPNYNALGALGSVSMDVICIVVLSILSVTLAFEKGEINTTTKLFLGLMLATLFALLFDYLNWAFDGSLEYGSMLYMFTITSFCMGSVLGALFIMYLSSYLYDMYNLKSTEVIAKVCIICNVVAFLITITLGIAKLGFVFTNGHYHTGPMYDVVAAIPILTLVIMGGFAVRHAKIIGAHDVFAVVAYICIMILGAVIEAIYSIGATYVSISVADVLIFVMLQNRHIDRVRKQREELAERTTSQYEILKSMAGIYSYVNIIDLEALTANRFDINENFVEKLDIVGDPHTGLNKRLYIDISENQKEVFLTYTDLSTLSERMKGVKIISADFCHSKDGWFRAQYIRIGDYVDAPVSKVIYAIRNIDEEKKNVEKWIHRSNTDELTGFYNRRAFEDEIASLKEGQLEKNFVYVSIDINGLKVTNDTLGHTAGDELILGACECMKQCFDEYGKLYRIGGDEFVALIYADDDKVEEIKKNVEMSTANWKGELVDKVAISCGYVTYKDWENLNFHQIVVLADKRMYEEKKKFYEVKGIDRRGQRDAHVALCNLYTKILKVNITEDSYQIVNMNDEEKVSELEYFDKISKWLYEFGVSGNVHPDDLEEYLSKTSIEYISNYFKRNKSSLSIFYRRRFGDGYKRVMMEIIPANEYSDEDQRLYLYVKKIEQ